MRALLLIPGDGARQLQVLPAAAALAEQLNATLQVACAPAVTPCWSLLPAVEKVLPFDFGAASLADWANLLGSVREPDFQLCLNLAGGRQVDLMLSMSHIPTRVAAAGFSATERITPPQGGWPNQALQAWLQPIGVQLNAEAFRLSLPRAELEKAAAALPAGSGPLLLLAPAGGAGDWPEPAWQELPDRIRGQLPDLRCQRLRGGSGVAGLRQRATQLACADVVLASDPIATELALLCGVPLVALGRSPDSLPPRQGVQGLGEAGALEQLSDSTVLQALGLG